ncbi:MAG: ribonuclease H family protein [Eubacteriales bacterium]|nr:ribonuclease H family protein [Eubacteriales bacterium]
MAKKYYAVAKGKTPGIYFTWDDCKAQIDHFSGAVYKGFATIEEAEAFISMAGTHSVIEHNTNITQSQETVAVSSKAHLVAYVDGSYEHSMKRYAYGCVLVFEDSTVELNGSGNDEALVGMRNVAGEILGSQCAIDWAIQNGYPEITIYYDYEGIEKWATGIWKANKEGTIAYKTFIEERREKIQIHFQKVAAHTGVEYNEKADQLAKEALGI